MRFRKSAASASCCSLVFVILWPRVYCMQSQLYGALQLKKSQEIQNGGFNNGVNGMMYEIRKCYCTTHTHLCN